MLTFCSGRPSAGRKCATAAKPKGIQNIFTQLWSGGLVDPHLVDLELWANHITAKHEAVFRPMQDELVVLANRIRDTLSGTASSTTTFDTSRLNSLPSLSYKNRLGKVPGPFPLAQPSLQLAACPCRHGYVTPRGVWAGRQHPVHGLQTVPGGPRRECPPGNPESVPLNSGPPL